jgi:hypothetical protein
VLAEAEVAALPQSAASLTLRNLTLKKQLAEFVTTQPDSSTTAVRAWLSEDTP